MEARGEGAMHVSVTQADSLTWMQEERENEKEFSGLSRGVNDEKKKKEQGVDV